MLMSDFAEHKRQTAELKTQREINALIESNAQLQRQVHEQAKAAVKKFWSRPIDVLLGPAARADLAQIDQELFAVPNGQHDDNAARNAYVSWAEELTAKTGYTLTETGRKRVTCYALSQAKFGKNLSQPSAWQSCFERLLECEAFTSDEVTYDPALKTYREPEPEPEPEPELTLAALDALPSWTEEGERLCRQIVHKHYFAKEAHPIWAEWVASVEKNFGHKLSEDEQRQAFDFFRDRNLSYLSRRNFDRCRVALVNCGVLPPSCLTEEEQLVQEIERKGIPTDYYAELELKNRIRKFQRKAQ